MLLATSVGASALSLGDLNIKSAVGQPFDAVIGFVAGRGETIAAQCIRARDDGSSAHPGVPFLANPVFTVAARPGGGEIMIRTRATVGEPALRLRIVIECASATLLAREFLLLLDAPVPTQLQPTVSAAVSPDPASVPLALASSRRDARRERRADTAIRASPTVRPTRAESTTSLGPSLRMGRPAAAERPADSARAPPARQRGAYRLTLSRPDDVPADLPLILSLKRSDELATLTTSGRTVAEAEREILRAQARLVLSDNPVADSLQMQARLATLESGMNGLKKQLGEIDAARAAAEDRARRLAEENRRLNARLDTFGIGVALLLCVIAAALGFWRFRVASERRVMRERAWSPAPEPATLSERTPPSPATSPVSADFERTIVLERPLKVTVPKPTVPPADLARSRAASEVAPAVPAPSTSPQRSVGGSAAPGPAHVPAVQEHAPVAFEPPATASVLRDEDMYLPQSALDGDGADEDDPYARATRPPTVRQKTLAYAPPKSAREPLAAGAARVPTERGRILGFEPAATAPMAAVPRASAATSATPFNFSLEAPDHDALDAVPAAEAAARTELYLAEFERKLFPEIALGRVKLDDPRSIIGLARTYYQEDFDPGKAVSFLEYALHRSTDPMLIHLALLEVLRMERRVREYATIARAFRGQYPDSGTYWQLVAAYGRLLDPADPTFEGERVPGLDLDTPSNWLGNTLDMTKYVLGQKVADSVRDMPAPVARAGA